MEVQVVIDLLKEQADAAYLKGMQRFGIDNTTALGVRLPQIRKLAKLIKKDHELALALWDTAIHEARLLATIIADPKQVTSQQMDSWAHEFYSWDVCDQACGNLFIYTPFALDKVIEYSNHQHEFVKRTAFVLIAEYAIHQKKASDDVFINLLPLIEREAYDQRNFVKKAVNWALRQIGKRNNILRTLAIETAYKISERPTRAAKWVASNALNELQKK
jgi:3-methyladenine DNA glycosylase AlkD